MSTTVRPHAPRPMGQDAARPEDVEHFDPGQVAQVPEPARRWLEHAIRPGTPLATTAHLTMHGWIRLGSWRPFEADQDIAPGDSFTWSARSSLFGLPVTGADRYRAGTGTSHWRLAGVLPVRSGHGLDVTRSAAGRLAAESVFVPTSLVGADWVDTGRDSVAFSQVIDGVEHVVELAVSPTGELRRVRLARWGDPDGRGYRRHTFLVIVDRELSVSGLRLPGSLRGRWASSTDDAGDFYRAQIDTATFR